MKVVVVWRGSPSSMRIANLVLFLARRVAPPCIWHSSCWLWPGRHRGAGGRGQASRQSGSPCEMKLLCDVRKADWRAEITVLLYLVGVTLACPPRWRVVPLLARPSPHLLARPPYLRDSAICAGPPPLCRRSGRVTVTGQGHGDQLKLACATPRTTTFAGFGACQSGLAAEMNSGGRAEKLGIDESSAAMWPPTVHSGTVRACAAKS
jgi:hypothetical protein